MLFCAMIRKMRGKGGWLFSSWGPWGPVVNNPHLFQVTDMGLAKITTSCDLKILRDSSVSSNFFHAYFSSKKNNL